MTIKDHVKASGTSNPLASGSIKAAEAMVIPGEEVLFAMTGNVALSATGTLVVDPFDLKDKLNGVIAITNKRILYCSNIMMNKVSKYILIKDITSVDDRMNGLLAMGQVRVAGISETLVIDITKKALEMFQQALFAARSMA